MTQPYCTVWYGYDLEGRLDRIDHSGPTGVIHSSTMTPTVASTRSPDPTVSTPTGPTTWRVGWIGSTMAVLVV